MAEISTQHTISIAYFVTDHGYGHATRAAAVMSAMAQQAPGICFEVFTTAPQWLFENKPAFRYRYHPEKTDVGLVQSTPFDLDLKTTLTVLSRFLPFETDTVNRIASYLRKIDCRMVICDIAPIGIEIANQAGIPAVLVENFTWDWIYEPFCSKHGGLERFSQYLRARYDSVEIRIQVTPYCQPHPGSLKTNPVCRQLTSERSAVRTRLGLVPSDSLVLVSMGGLALQSQYHHAARGAENVVFAIPGSSQSPRRHENVIELPSHSATAHQDLVNAADAVIGKVGYSTLAEVHQAGVPFGFLARDDFRESAVLTEFIEDNIPSVALDMGKYLAGKWSQDLETLLTLPRVNRKQVNGAQQVARHLMSAL